MLGVRNVGCMCCCSGWPSPYPVPPQAMPVACVAFAVAVNVYLAHTQKRVWWAKRWCYGSSWRVAAPMRLLQFEVSDKRWTILGHHSYAIALSSNAGCLPVVDILSCRCIVTQGSTTRSQGQGLNVVSNCTYAAHCLRISQRFNWCDIS